MYNRNTRNNSRVSYNNWRQKSNNVDLKTAKIHLILQRLVNCWDAESTKGGSKKDDIIRYLQTSDTAVIRGLVRIYLRQTLTEQAVNHTGEVNGIGFSKIDAEILSSFAKGYATYGKLTPKQMEVARKRMLKYAGQLTKISNGE